MVSAFFLDLPPFFFFAIDATPPIDLLPGAHADTIYNLASVPESRRFQLDAARPQLGADPGTLGVGTV
jgi:hypothetical protein